MVGIFGCILKEGNVAPVVHKALKRLEYRGYDSAGEATIHEGRLHVKKDHGKIDDVHAQHNLDNLPGRIGLGHIRWATHGAPMQVNAHPHLDCRKEVAVVQNGIIENYADIKGELEELGHTFESKTDTEVVPHLIEEKLQNGLSFIEAVRETLKRLEGSFAVAIVYVKDSDKILCAQKENSLAIGLSDTAVYCSSDIPTFLPMTKKTVLVENGELVILRDGDYEIRDFTNWNQIVRKPRLIDWIPEVAQKEGFPHFMIKEIHAQPACLRSTIRLQEEYLDLMTAFLDRAKELFLVACGTSYHACLAASYMFSKMAFLSTHPVYASEFIEQVGKSVNIDSTILALSQSGETADTLAAVDYARSRAATILGLTNVVGSTLTRVSRVFICQQAGPEIGVAATKTFTAQLSVLAQIALKLAEKRGKVSHVEMERFKAKLRQIPNIIEKIIQTQEEKVKQIAKKYRDKPYFLFFGRGISSAVTLESTLKLLETNQIPSLTYSGGEVDGDIINLIQPGYPAIFVCPKDDTHKKIVGDIAELKARGASIVAIIEEGDEQIKDLADDYVEVMKDVPEFLSPIQCIIPLQLFAYYMAVGRGLDPDRPRHLTKAVTVK
ncbi:MAG: glutamine--fructose-6-phosphate transaminase (isomerizing) [Candidatus Bathyarchaeota archaeon]|nr:glutamine--fructose-6-phosphate transaminase (isomerizing) [Candidatus Bathyarchaeota archaeon]